MGRDLIMARLGRRRIRIEKIENKKKRSVTFSKRRYGLFKKESELSMLCDSPNATVVFSPDDETCVYSIGYPCVNSVLDKFMDANPPQNLDDTGSLSVHRRNAIREGVLALMEIEEEFEEEKKREKSLDTGISYENLNSSVYQNFIEKIEIGYMEAEQLAIELKERNVPFPYSTFGDALAPK